VGGGELNVKAPRIVLIILTLQVWNKLYNREKYLLVYLKMHILAMDTTGTVVPSQQETFSYVHIDIPYTLRPRTLGCQ
jgi:hypothetical protein